MMEMWALKLQLQEVWCSDALSCKYFKQMLQKKSQCQLSNKMLWCWESDIEICPIYRFQLLWTTHTHILRIHASLHGDLLLQTKQTQSVKCTYMLSSRTAGQIQQQPAHEALSSDETRIKRTVVTEMLLFKQLPSKCLCFDKMWHDMNWLGGHLLSSCAWFGALHTATIADAFFVFKVHNVMSEIEREQAWFKNSLLKFLLSPGSITP